MGLDVKSNEIRPKQSVHQFARESGRQVHLIAESDFNDVRFIQPVESGGYGLDAQWDDDFHHAVRSLLTGEAKGYYRDFGKTEHLRKALALESLHQHEGVVEAVGHGAVVCAGRRTGVRGIVEAARPGGPEGGIAVVRA